MGVFIFISHCFDRQGPVFDDRHLAVVEVHHAFGVFNDGRCVGGQVVFVYTNANDQGRTFAGRHDGLWILFRDHHNSVGAHHLIQC